MIDTETDIETLPESPLEAIKATEAHIAVAKAGTRRRRMWGYVRESILLSQLTAEDRQHRNTVTADDARAFFANDGATSASLVEFNPDPEKAMYAVWLGDKPPRYIRDLELKTWSAGVGVLVTDENLLERVLARFDLTDDTSAGVEKSEDERGIYYAVRTKTAAPDAPPSF